MRKFFFMVVTGFIFQSVSACTTFFITKNGHFAFGRNYDWVTDAGMLCTNLRGLTKTSAKMPEGSSVKWVSKYGSITFNQYGKEFPMGGMNEKGLVVEMMWLDGSQYPKPDKRPSLNVLQWIQYQLDNCATVKEVLATNKKVRISPQVNPPIHYLVADASGQAATIEFLDGKMVVHKGDDLPLPALANTAYATSSRLIMDVDETKSLSNEQSDSYIDNSVKRFAYACAMVRKYQQTDIDKPIVDYSFEILDKVNQPEFTKWSIVYDVSNMTVYFKSASFNDVKSVAFADVDFSCSGTPLALDINQAAKGNVKNMLAAFSDELNMGVMQKAVAESKQQVSITDQDIDKMVAYAAQIKCGG
jgi:penicillin V acylase-like amidase (Ntn superfamily)